MRILIIHQPYLMPGQGGGSRINEMARLWAEAGHEVSVIAGTLAPDGKKPPRYRRRWLVKEKDGLVTIWRCYMPEHYGRSYHGRMWGYLAFGLSASTALLYSKKPDITLATSPPLTVAIQGILAGRFRWGRNPWIFEVRDLWPESAVTTGVLSPRSALTSALYTLERWAYRLADSINVLTPAFRDNILDRRLANAEKLAFIPNGADLDLFQPGQLDNDLRRRLAWGDRFVVLYAGAHGRANALGQLIDAAEHLRDRSEILIACVGEGPERATLEATVRARGLNNIVFLGPQPKDKMPEFINAANAGAAVLQNNPTFRTVYPNKVFDYMACRRPTLLAIDGVARRLVCEEARAGVFAEPENGAALASAIRYLADNPAVCEEMGARGYEWVVANADRKALAVRYLDLMTELLRGRLNVRSHDHGPGQAQLHQSRSTDSAADEHTFVITASDQHARPSIGRTLVADRLRKVNSGTFVCAVKRVVDLAVTLLMLPIACPVMAVIAFAIWLRNGRPVLFSQTRVGAKRREFKLYKFSSMTLERDSTGRLLPDAERLTVLGKKLRDLSLDELPQIWNVLNGDMSLVGPRPLLPAYLPRYTARQGRRHDVKPGITGWAQINGRNSITWESKFELDVWYVEHWSLVLDLRILVATLGKVLHSAGIAHPGEATMREFLGSSDESKQAQS